MPTEAPDKFAAIDLKGVRMTVCQGTGLFVPECSCRLCLRALMERHRPSHLAAGAAPRAPEADDEVASGQAQTRFEAASGSGQARPELAPRSGETDAELSPGPPKANPPLTPRSEQRRRAA